MKVIFSQSPLGMPNVESIGKTRLKAIALLVCRPTAVVTMLSHFSQPLCRDPAPVAGRRMQRPPPRSHTGGSWSPLRVDMPVFLNTVYISMTSIPNG